MDSPFEKDVKNCVLTLQQDGVILYPTDTIWGLGCDVQNEKAIQKIVDIKKRDPNKSFIVLMTDVRQLAKHIANPPLDLEEMLEKFDNPTTIIYPNAIHLPQSLLAADGSVAVRITKDPFCRSLIKRLRSPLVSTSANLSGMPAAATFSLIDEVVKTQVDYTVIWRQDDQTHSQPSSILKLEPDGGFTKIR
ncbi:MAG: threonylcarbamoyl-AMP synthase [Bacteroidetes bacterium]|nr:threonylcarbamoyl-AMP synthase [Bacteroidota bacterium]MBP6315959.1 threonylcarbamoyl-AMP synthase [Chitinophagaceae bacterium]